MRLGDLLGRFGGSAGKTVEAPLRAIVHEVLREQGYASPAELQALRDEARDLKGRLDRLDSKVAELGRLLDAARADVQAARDDATAARLEAGVARSEAGKGGGQDDRVPALQSELERLAAHFSGMSAQAAPSHEREPLSAAPRGSCKVEGCDQGVRSKGFCSAHYQQWRRGTLKGFVGLDGDVEVDGHTLKIDPEYAGGAVRLDGELVLVDGVAV
jgi:hypothetical protein